MSLIMINVSKFVKNHIPLCARTLGVILGNWGYHSVQWIINKCHKTEKIDHVAQKNIGPASTERISLSNNDIIPLHVPSPHLKVQVAEIILRQESETQEKSAATKIQSAYRGHVARLALKKLQVEKLEEQKSAAAIKIQSSYRRHLAQTKLKKLQLQEVAATKIQSVYRGYKARLALRQPRSTYSVKPLTIVDARDSGMEWQDVRTAVRTIANKELKDDEGWVPASNFIKEEYFKGIPIAPGASSPETILLAKVANDIVGFIISARREDKGLFLAIPADTGYVAYLAVDSTIKRSGVGTKLMLAAMCKTKELGKRYLTLEYIAVDLGVNKQRGRAKIGFYNSFTTKFGIPMEERNKWPSLHVHPYYDLKDVDFGVIK